MVYASPVAEEFVTGQFYDRMGTPFYLSPNKLESDYSPVRFERELRYFRRHCRSGTVLDVGCSTGAFLYQLSAQNPGCYRVLGTDVTSSALDYAEQKGIEVVRESFLEHDFGERTFDAITFWAVLEHLAQPSRFLTKAKTLLKLDGLCFVLVPNLNSLATRLLGAKYRYIMPDHINYFTTATLKRLVSTVGGLEVVEIGFLHFNPIVIWQDLRGGARRVPDEQRAQLLKRTTAYKQNPVLAPLKAAYRFSEGVLSRLGLADNIVFVLRRIAVDAH
jgi:2-polyprenyl-3-methyl-5-hydroxy-6-metoxy-1,4-benzoquinol methylase